MPGFSGSNGSSASTARFASVLALSACLLGTSRVAADTTDAEAEAEAADPAAKTEKADSEAADPAAGSETVNSEAAVAAAESENVDAEAAVAAAENKSVEALKVEQGKDHAVVVEDPTTPVLPDKDTFPKRAYQLQWEIDVPLFAIGAALAMGREIRSTNSSAPAYCTTIPEGCDEDDLNAVDKPFAGTYDESWSEVTDVIVLGLYLAPWPMLWINNNFLNALNDVTIIYESCLTALALSGLATMSAQRARPFVYGTKAPEEVRTSPNGALSFVSGHTTQAFALSTSTFWTIYRRHGPGVYAWTTLAVGTAAASAVAVGRVAAGKHFPTDVVTGALVGASVGTLIPALHDAPVVVVPTVDKEGASIQVSTSL